MDKKQIKQITELLEGADVVITMIDGNVGLCGSETQLMAGLSTIIHAIRHKGISDEKIEYAINLAMKNDIDDLEQKVGKLSDILKSLKELITK